MDWNTPFETGAGSIRNRPAFNRKCSKDTVTDIVISGNNGMDKGSQRSFFIRVYGQEAGYGQRTGRDD